LKTSFVVSKTFSFSIGNGSARKKAAVRARRSDKCNARRGECSYNLSHRHQVKALALKGPNISAQGKRSAALGLELLADLISPLQGGLQYDVSFPRAALRLPWAGILRPFRAKTADIHGKCHDLMAIGYAYNLSLQSQ
jgi:hypothetical protein